MNFCVNKRPSEFQEERGLPVVAEAVVEDALELFIRSDASITILSQKELVSNSVTCLDSPSQ